MWVYDRVTLAWLAATREWLVVPILCPLALTVAGVCVTKVTRVSRGGWRTLRD
jgi:hypothetical protein